MPRLSYDPANDYYTLLGLTPRATPDQVQRAFRRLAKEVHPDRNPEDQGRATARFQALNEAYHVLDDPDLRREYDRLRWPHLRFEPAPASGEAWASYSRTAESSGPRIDDEWFRRARWEYNNWVRSAPPPTPARPSNRAGLSLLALLRGPFGWVYLMLTVTILFMPLIYLVITGWAEQAQAWLHPSVPPAGAATCTALDALITVPREGARVPTRFDVLGSASPPDLAEYRLELAPLAVPNSPAELRPGDGPRRDRRPGVGAARAAQPHPRRGRRSGDRRRSGGPRAGHVRAAPQRKPEGRPDAATLRAPDLVRPTLRNPKSTTFL